MYKLELADGTVIENIDRLNPSTFQFRSDNPDYYWILSPSNLAFATLYKDDELEDIFIDYMKTSYLFSSGWVRFRIIPVKEVEAQEERAKLREEKKHRKYAQLRRMEDEMDKKGW